MVMALDEVVFVFMPTGHKVQKLPKYQPARAMARIYPEAEKGGRGKNSTVAVEFSSQRLSYARTVLRHAPELADSGAAAFDFSDKLPQFLLRPPALTR